MKALPLCATIALIALLPSCTIVRGTSNGQPPQVRFNGVVDGYIGFGWPESDSLVRLDVLDGRSSGSVAYLEIWRLLRLEIGVAGAAVGIGPFDFGIGTLFYEPASPRYGYDEEEFGPLPDPDKIEWQGREPEALETGEPDLLERDESAAEGALEDAAEDAAEDAVEDAAEGEPSGEEM